MENEGTVDPSEMKEKVIFELAADGTCEFENGEPIRIGRGMLAIHSVFFMESFFGLHKTKIKIKGFDRESFKTFLDCLFGLKEYTLQDALVIYPIAHRYEVKESLNKCTAALKPKDVNENVSRVLNLATFYKCNKLTDYVINLIRSYGVANFLENEEYSSSIEPAAMLTLIENVNFNSLMWRLIYQWGQNFLKQREKSDIRSFFVENGIFEKISLTHFESAKAVTDFHVTSNKQLLDPNEILHLLEMNTIQFNKKIPDRSDWVKINKGDVVFERIAFKDLFYCTTKKARLELTIQVWLNKILIEPDYLLSDALKVNIRYIFRKILLNIDYKTSKIANPVRRSDLNFFYREALLPKAMDYLISPFAQGEEFDMVLVDEGSETPSYKCLVNSTVLGLEIHSVEITYSFNCSCRILKTSLDTDKNLVDENNSLYFTRKGSISEVK